MVGQSFTPHDVGPLGVKRREKPCRMGDAREGQNPFAFPVHSHLQGHQGPPQPRHRDQPPPGRIKPRLRRLIPDRQDQISPGQPYGHRLAQRSRRNAAPVAEAARGVYHHQSERRLHRRALEPVIQQDHLRPGRFRRTHAFGAILRHPDRREG